MSTSISISSNKDNPNLINFINDGPIVTGTTLETISDTVLLAANTLSLNSVLQIQSRFIRTSGNNGSVIFRLRTNTTPSLVGSTLLATSQTMTLFNQFTPLYRMLKITNGGDMQTMINTFGIATDLTSQTLTNILFDITNTNYLIFTVQPFSLSDSFRNSFATIQVFN